ncbi:MAG TPA: DUF6702 family protein [Cyclobacteriaceae bacterium]|jgi:hypothetical protein
MPGLLVPILPIFFSFSGNVLSEVNHAIYLSVCEVDHREQGNSAEINVKVFETDIRDAFQNMFSLQADFNSARATSAYKEESEQYFKKYLKIVINGQRADLKFSSLELNGDSVWFYFTITCNKEWASISVTADYLMELFPDQSNIISVYHGDDKKFFRITRTKKTDQASFRN